MTDTNHRRKNKAPVNQRLNSNEYNNGFGCFNKERGNIQRVGNTDKLDKSMHGWSKTSEFTDKTISASIGNDYSKGSRGMAKAVKGAKKFVRTRTRFHENALTKKLGKEYG